jgi:hypothetical protein
LDSVLIGFLSGQGQGLRSAFCDPGPLTQALRRHGFPSPIHPDKRGHCPEVPTGPRMTHRVPASGHPSLGVRSTRWGGAGSPAPPDARALAARPGCRAGEGPAVRGAIITLASLGRARGRVLLQGRGRCPGSRPHGGGVAFPGWAHGLGNSPALMSAPRAHRRPGSAARGLGSACARPRGARSGTRRARGAGGDAEGRRRAREG